ncbi:MAG: efflux RND transporter periplasmic adaptor subunit [Myxococcota bacterium]
MSARSTALLLAPLLLLVGCRQQEGAVKLPDEPTPVEVETEPPRSAATATGEGGPDEARGHVVFTGSTEPHRRSTLSPEVSGRVAEVKVREGDAVEEGQVLVLFDLESLKLGVRQARAALDMARVQLWTARIEAERMEQLLGDEAVAERQFDLADAQRRTATVGVEQAKVARDQAEKALSDAEVVAPYDAVVTRRHISEGEFASAVPATPLLTLEEVSTIDARIQIPSARIRQVAEGTPVRVRIPSLDYEVDTTVTRIVPSVNPATRTQSVLIELDNPEGLLRPGLFVEMTVRGPAAVEPEPEPEVDAEVKAEAKAEPEAGAGEDAR